jgi:hypothetical protein
MGRIVTPSQVTGFKPFKPTKSITAIGVWTSHTHFLLRLSLGFTEDSHYGLTQVIHISILIIVAKITQLTHSFEAHPSFAVPSLAANQNLGAATGATGNSKKAALSHLPSGYLT